LENPEFNGGLTSAQTIFAWDTRRSLHYQEFALVSLFYLYPAHFLRKKEKEWI
jgi:hypothetical protein